MRTELRVLPLIHSALRVPDQTGWWSHAFVPDGIEEAIPRLGSRAP